MKDKNIYLNHYDILAAFNEDYYKDLITKDHLGDETVIKYNDEQRFIYPVKYKGKLYAIPSSIIEQNKMPIKITKSVKTAYKSYVYHYVTKFSSVRIVENKALDFRELVNNIGDFNHTTKDTEFLIYKIAIISLYLRKGFCRTVSGAGFGKNSIPNIIKSLMTDVAIINPRSTAALEHKLIHKYIILDELTNLSKDQRDLMQEALLRIGDFTTSYEKGTRGSSKIGTKDEYNISKLSITILFNVLGYYVKSNQQNKYFDYVFQPALLDRFLPLKFDGILDTTQFIHVSDPVKIAKELKEDIKNIIKSMKYYQLNFEKEQKSFIVKNIPRLSKTGRIDKTFAVILKGINLYSRTQEEFDKYSGILYEAHLKYGKMMDEYKVEEILLDENDKPIKEKNKEVTGSNLTKFM